MRVRVEHGIDDWVRVAAVFSQRLDHRSPPELARLESFEIHQCWNTLAEDRNQSAISPERREIVGGFVRIDEVAGSGFSAVDPERSFGRIKRDQLVAERAAFKSERIESACERTPSM